MSTSANNLQIEFTLPLSGSLNLDSWPTFKEEDFPTISSEKLSIRLWFNAESAIWATPFTDAELKKLRNPRLYRINVSVVVREVASDLGNWISTTKNSHDPVILSKEYRLLADEVYDLTANCVNRLIAFARANKGQFWIDEYVLTESKDVHQLRGSSPFQVTAKAKFGNSEWFAWYPPSHPIVIKLAKDHSNPRYLTNEDWLSAWQFVKSPRRSDLVLDLLVSAETLSRNRHQRSALTEAVTALEVAVYNFARKPSASSFVPTSITNRFNVQGLDKLVKHLGFTATMNWLFPLIFTEEQVSSNTLNICRAAMEQRNNVVHNGQRNVANLDEMLLSLREMCIFLLQSSEDLSEIDADVVQTQLEAF